VAVIVFGGSGFVGTHLVKALLDKDKSVIICDILNAQTNPGAKFIRCDVTNPADISKVPCSAEDIVVNLAANQYHHKVPRKERYSYFFNTNVMGARNILEHIKQSGGRKFIQYTTDMTYGKPQYLPIDTKHPQVPFGPYGESKKEAEIICCKYRQKNVDITIFRPRMIIGPGRLGILKKLFFLIDHNLPVPTIGSGKNCYQMVSVFDCVSAIMAAIKNGCPNKEYNLGSKCPPSERDLLRNLVKKAESRSPVIPTPGKAVKVLLGILGYMGLEIMYKEQYMIADEDYILDISETEKDLKWSPLYNDQDMIIQAYQEYLTYSRT
jgi:dTDP-glucose 4,6-dehydratase